MRSTPHPIEKADFNFGHCFSYLAKQNLGKTVVTAPFDDSKWTQVQLPHDWGMELPFSEKADGNWGSRPLGRAFPDTSVGWYRKTFDLAASDKGRRISVEFEGVSHDCVVLINGYLVGTHASGYTSFSQDVTDLLNYGGKNTLVVRVDARENEGWWYQGAGIYRHVWLTKTAPVHIPLWGTQILTHQTGNVAQVTINAEVANDSKLPVDGLMQSSIIDEAGQIVATTPPARFHAEARSKASTSSLADISAPKLWSTTTPTLYRGVTTVKVAEVQTDRYETTFGVRTLRFDPDQGFFLNEKPLKIRGFCDHGQHVIVGTAMPDSLWTWQLKKLQEEVGANAIRTSHNAPSPALLDACDRLGLMVMDEQRIFSSGEEGLKQLESLVRRDRNHPSIIIWSAGNEEWGVQSRPASVPVMERLKEEFHRLDPSRLVTFAASNGGDWEGVNQAAEVRGINYLSVFKQQHKTPASYHAAHPQQPVIGSEEDQGGEAIPFMEENPWYSGTFIWTGLAYYGESKWPQVVAPFGVMDLCGFPREPFYTRFQKGWGGKSRKDQTSRANPSALRLNADRNTLNADGADTAVINIDVVDDANQRVLDAPHLVTVELTGPGRILGVGNGDSKDHTSTKDLTHATFEGRAQVLVQALRESGPLHIHVTSPGLRDASAVITSQDVKPEPYIP